MDDKIIVTNKSALVQKYGKKGLSAISKAVADLKAADKNRGIITRLMFLDDKVEMEKLGGSAVENNLDPRQNKAAIDAIFKSLDPDYLMILGAPDVIPHQDLRNPVYSPPDDDDPYAWGDLPYASDVAYSADAARFVGLTRVVGRLPDLAGAKEPSHILSLLKIAKNYKSRPQKEYAKYFALSAEVWKGSTRMSLNNIFGNDQALKLAPSSGPKFPKPALMARMHFINCHGGQASPMFEGQKGKKYPVALTTAATVGNINEGSVAAVECCYGAQLYDSVTLGSDKPICQSYLGQGAYGYFGSTTIAYGPANENGSADLICQFFLLNILDGASIGRAALMARQQFVAGNSQMDPVDLKTLAQFCLLGDPSVHPVAEASATETPKYVPAAEAERFFRGERRSKLRLTGEFLQNTKPTASVKSNTGTLSKQTKSALSNIAASAGLNMEHPYAAYEVEGASAARSGSAKAASAPSRYLIAIGTPKNGKNGNTNRGVAVVAKELEGRIVGYRVYHQR